jgi:hypothetical protein
MKFDEKLWVFKTLKKNAFEIVNNNFLTKRKSQKEFLILLTEKYRYDVEYAKGMKKLYEYNYILTNEK